MVDHTNDCRDCINCNQKIPFFDTLSEEELAFINEDRYSVTFKPDELILKQGITATHIISIIEGITKIYIEGINNKNLLFSLAGPWSLIEDPGLETENRIHQFSVSALSTVKVCFINSNNFNKVLEQNSRFANAVIKHRSRNTVYYFKRLISLTQKHMLGRMADGLIYLSSDFYKSEEFNLALTRQDLADLTGMSKDSAIRILKDFEREHIISLNNKKIKILNKDQLNKLSVHG